MREFGDWVTDVKNFTTETPKEEVQETIKEEEDAPKKYVLDCYGELQAVPITEDDYLSDDYWDEGDQEDDAYERWREDKDNDILTDGICYKLPHTGRDYEC